MRFTSAVRISSLSSLANPARYQPSGPTIRLRPGNLQPRSVPMRSAATTKMLLQLALTMARWVPMVRSSAGGMSTQLVGQHTTSAPFRARMRKFSKYHMSKQISIPMRPMGVSNTW